MKIMLSILTALTFVSPLVGRAQTPSSYAQAIDSAPPALVLVKANRAGISAEQDDGLRRPIVQSTADPPCSCRRSRGYHVLMGAVTGTLGGAALGAAGGAIYDAHADGGDYMIPGSVILAAYGTVIGLVVGTVVGLAWPTK
jgi:hypothetical protein